MNTMQYSGQTNMVILGIKPGEKLLESIKTAIDDLDIQNGAVISGIGTLKTCQLHYVTNYEFPPCNKYFTIKKPLEISAISGIIANKQPHFHIVVSHADKIVYSGHLENGSEVLYLAEIVIMVFNNFKMARYHDKEKHIDMLNAIS